MTTPLTAGETEAPGRETCLVSRGRWESRGLSGARGTLLCLAVSYSEKGPHTGPSCPPQDTGRCLGT